MTGADRRRPAARVLGDHVAQRRLVGAPRRRRSGPGSRRQVRLATATASASSATRTSTTPLAPAPTTGPTSSGATSPSPPPSIIAGPPMPIDGVRVAMITSQQPAARRCRRSSGRGPRRPAGPARECGRTARSRHVEAGDHRAVGVARTAAAALGEEDHRQAHPLDQLEQPVLLPVVRAGPGCRRAPCSRRTAPRRRAFAEEVTVTRADAGDQPVGGGAADQVVEFAAAALRGDREAAVLDEGAGVDQVVDVLAGRPLPPAAWRLSTASGRAASSVSARRASSSSRPDGSGRSVISRTYLCSIPANSARSSSPTDDNRARITDTSRSWVTPTPAFRPRRHAATVGRRRDDLDSRPGLHRTVGGRGGVHGGSSRWLSSDYCPPATCSAEGAVTAVMTALGVARWSVSPG